MREVSVVRQQQSTRHLSSALLLQLLYVLDAFEGVLPQLQLDSHLHANKAFLVCGVLDYYFFKTVRGTPMLLAQSVTHHYLGNLN